MTKNINNDALDRISSDKLIELNDELHEVLCKSIISQFQDFIEGPGISEEQLESAREFAELKPDTEAAKEVFEFLDSSDVQKALIRGAPE